MKSLLGAGYISTTIGAWSLNPSHLGPLRTRMLAEPRRALEAKQCRHRFFAVTLTCLVVIDADEAKPSDFFNKCGMAFRLCLDSRAAVQVTDQRNAFGGQEVGEDFERFVQ